MATNWDAELPGCFGCTDMLFARHPLDEERAFRWLASLRSRQVGWTKAESQIKAFLESKNVSVAQIDAEIAYAYRMLSLWLLD